MAPIPSSMGLDTPNTIDDFGEKYSFMFSSRCITYNYKYTDPTRYNNRKWQVQNPYDREDILSTNAKRLILQDLREIPTIYL